LLFAVGALCAAPSPDVAAPLNLALVLLLLSVAAILGDTTNYWIGNYVGPRVFRSETGRFLNRQNLEKAHEFYEKYGGKAIILCRFMPFFRTFVPFVAGIGKMSCVRFVSFNVLGGLSWVASFTLLGFYFGNREIVKKNFSLVIWSSSSCPSCPRFLNSSATSGKSVFERILEDRTDEIHEAVPPR